MTFTLILCLVAGVLASFVGGALSGLRIGKDALGAELAVYMGGLYGVLAGGMAVVVTTIILLLT
ncbi:hypothetical protein [Pseudosulfitobacter pseudonitzschiae]|uniref:hypothetical protein n=1 Tax=Pseudosulfitobacter pseudonitzschiae TaxID=1402135 RepID=UPI003B7B7403